MSRISCHFCPHLVNHKPSLVFPKNSQIFLNNSVCRTRQRSWRRISRNLKRCMSVWSCHRVTPLFYLRRHLSRGLSPCFNQSSRCGCAYQVAVECRAVWHDESAAVDEAQLRSDRYLEGQRIRGRLSDSECWCHLSSKSRNQSHCFPFSLNENGFFSLDQ